MTKNNQEIAEGFGFIYPCRRPDGGLAVLHWDKQLLKKMAYYGNVWLNFVVATVIGFSLGYYLIDPWARTFPFITVLGTVFGIAAGIYRIYKLSRYDRDIS